MKNSKQCKWVLAVLLLLLITTSCNKETDKQMLDNILHRNRCLVTHSEEDFNVSSFDIFYNNHKDIDSIKLSFLYRGNYTVYPGYDKIGRLNTIHFGGSQEYEAVFYTGLVTIIKYYVPNYTYYGMADSLAETITFKYNFRGELLQVAPVNIWYPGYDYTLNYVYNNDENVTSVTNVPVSGTPSTVVYTATSYDHKPNFIGGNPYLNYLLFQLGFEPDYYLLTSRNNPINWSWYLGGFGYNFASTFDYNREGFANKIFLHVVDSDGNLTGDFTRTSGSTCGSAPASLPGPSPEKSSLIQNKIRKFKTQLLPWLTRPKATNEN